MTPGKNSNHSAGRPPLAYIDGGLALFLFQAAIAGVLGVAWTAKSYWHRIKTWFGGGAVPAEPEENEPGT